MTNDTRKALAAILDAAASRARPVRNYAQMPAEEFVIIWHYLICVRTFSVMLLESGVSRSRGQMISNRELHEIDKISQPPITRENILGLAEWYFEPGLFWVFAELMCEEPHIINELERRLSDRRITKNLVITRLTVGVKGNIPLVKKLLKIDKIQAFPTTDRAIESADLKQQALLKALDAIDEESKIRFVPFPPYPLLLRPDIRQVWETEVAESWKREMESSLGKIKAGLLLKDEVLQQKVREHLRNFWDTIKGRKTVFAGRENFPFEGPEAWRADWDHEPHAKRSRQEEIQSEVHPKPDEKVKTAPDISARMFEVLKEVQKQKRWGKKAIKAFRYYLDGKTEKEASRLAGIDPRAFRNYKAKLKKIFASKK